VVNDSTSTASRAWPTRWPQDSFRGFGTIALVAVVVVPFLLELVWSVFFAPPLPAPQYVSQLAVIESLATTASVEACLTLAVLLALPVLSKFSLAELGFRRPTLVAVSIGIAGGLAMAIVSNGLASLIETLAHSKHQQDVIEIFRALHDPTTIVVFAVFAVVFAPFVEETLFRVFFFNLGLRYGGFWAGAILSGVLFGIAHGDVYAAIPLAAGGMILSYVYYTTRNAYASMISHAFFNALSIAALLFVPQLAQ
jgi:membrane protease YdiL (CAAX protease family)